MKAILSLATAAVCSALLGACATSSPDVVRPYEAQRLSTVIDAVVLSVRPVTIDGSQSGIGGVAGAVVGNVAGASVGGYRDSLAAGIIGAVIGGVIGNSIERGATTQSGEEIVVQLRNGQRRAVVQAKGAETFNTGEPVLLIYTGNRVSVTKAPVTLMPVMPAPAPRP